MDNIHIGRHIDIYQDPWTKNNLEGRGEVRKIYKYEAPEWTLAIKFPGERRLVTRRHIESVREPLK